MFVRSSATFLNGNDSILLWLDIFSIFQSLAFHVRGKEMWKTSSTKSIFMYVLCVCIRCTCGHHKVVKAGFFKRRRCREKNRLECASIESSDWIIVNMKVLSTWTKFLFIISKKYFPPFHSRSFFLFLSVFSHFLPRHNTNILIHLYIYLQCTNLDLYTIVTDEMVRV